MLSAGLIAHDSIQLLTTATDFVALLLFYLGGGGSSLFVLSFLWVFSFEDQLLLNSERLFSWLEDHPLSSDMH